MTVLDTLREFHAHDILSVRLDSLPRLTGLTELAVAAQVRDLRKAGRLFVDRGYVQLVVSAAPGPDELGMKPCSKCQQEKPLDDFPKDIRNRDGRQSHCRQCQSRISVKSRANRRAKAREQGVSN